MLGFSLQAMKVLDGYHGRHLNINLWRCIACKDFKNEPQSIWVLLF